MAISQNIRTYFDGQWHDGDRPVMRAADHGAWLGSVVFDGARQFNGKTPDLDAHCARLNRSAEALMLRPTVSVEDMIARTHEGLKGFAPDAAIYIRPMYWGISGDATAIVPQTDETGFTICLEEVPMPPETASITLGYTRFHRPTLDTAVVNAKASCLYPNSARMIAEAQARGFNNALVADAMGNVAETGSTNVFIVRDGEVFTPIPNGTFLAGITRARHIANLRADGITVHECVLSFSDVEQADEVFVSGNMTKIVPVTRIEETEYAIGPITRRARALYWDWAAST
ncbi:MAG: branched-chain amino acid aminotransferase [Marivivens sp.]|jgi:branched-chain amino acid aminotransferase|nr:branched-chain amino acid aminotransferase [Marivivens sp.]